MRPTRLRLGLGMTACGSVAAVTAVCAPAEPAAEKSEPGKHVDETPLEEGPLRYVVYARRAVQAFLVKGRLIAYTTAYAAGATSRKECRAESGYSAAYISIRLLKCCVAVGSVI